jgi:hypothetical protein
MKNALTRLFVASVILAGLPGPAAAQYAIVEIEKVQIVKSLSGVVSDTSGAPIPGCNGGGGVIGSENRDSEHCNRRQRGLYLASTT